MEQHGVSVAVVDESRNASEGGYRLASLGFIYGACAGELNLKAVRVWMMG